MGMTLRPTVSGSERPQELRWLGHLLVPGPFDVEHRFVADDLASGCVRFAQEERFTGLLVPIVVRSLDRQTRAGFRAMD
jgi:hypothetical protein